MAKILVIEDEPQIKKEVMDWLTFEGYTVSGAENGRLGLEAAIRDVPDLILCDIAMPEMDGHSVLLEVRSTPNLNRIPFIFLTASAEREAVRKGMDLGADDYITKPFTRAEVLSSVRSRLEKQATQDSLVRAYLDLLNSELTEEREKRLLKSRLVAMFSHDFRNPLSAILASIELIRTYEERLSSDQKHNQLERIERSVRLLLQMLDDMLLLAQMESGHLDCEPLSIDVSAFVEDIVDEFRMIYHDTHQLVFESDVRSPFDADPKLFRQIVANLISNAVKFSPPQSTVTVYLLEDTNTLTLEVQDNGIGIPPEDISNLFEPFHRAPNAKEIRGTGLGLSIVKQAVDVCGGSVQVKSKIGQGTRFVVRFPRIGKK